MILITGIAGGIGSFLAVELLKNGFTVLGIDNLSTGTLFNLIQLEKRNNFKFLEGDILDQDFLKSLPWNEINTVIHLAAISSLPECQIDEKKAIAVNLTGTLNILEYSSKYGSCSLFINASTSAVYEGLNEFPYKEEMKLNPHLIYPLTKLWAEQLTTSYNVDRGFNSYSLRFFNVFGPNQDFKRKSPPLLNYIIRQLILNQKSHLYSKSGQTRDYISIIDIVQAILRIIEKRTLSESVYNICSGQGISVNGIINSIEDSLNLKIDYVFEDAETYWDKYETLFNSRYPLKKTSIVQEVNKNSLGDPSKIIFELDWAPNPDPLSEQFKIVSRLTYDYIKETIKHDFK